ncbi:uncharacterized protein LOC110048078 isoform X1 [Orbicella faveolata]|uniref:uncharacterized protein LOC110048078 isoform X1 n=1 Tax=Orbicella faveolata TaxID=48498 RepID=UPI0009E4DACE|nr:uncharacterized protein LOC110048078 isoform X1 [Orbicella faveolata]
MSANRFKVSKADTDGTKETKETYRRVNLSTDIQVNIIEPSPERKANKQGNFVAGKAGNLALYEDEIQKRPRISTLLESLSRYEAVLSPQQDDEEGEAKTAKSSQVRVYKKVLYRQNKAKSSCVFILVMQILSYGFENILNY